MASFYTPPSGTKSASRIPIPEEVMRQEEFRRMEYTTACGFDPSQRWSSDFTVPSSSAQTPSSAEEIQRKTGYALRKRTGPYNHTTVDFDEFGNYIYQGHLLKEPPTPPPSPPKKSPEEQMLQKARRDQWKLQRMNESLYLQCTLCKETILQKTIDIDRKFGLLPQCKHVFCLRCIASKGKIGRCPECNVKYTQIIPSKFYVRCEKQKQKMVEAMINGRQFFDQESKSPTKLVWCPTPWLDGPSSNIPSGSDSTIPWYDEPPTPQEEIEDDARYRRRNKKKVVNQ